MNFFSFPVSVWNVMASTTTQAVGSQYLSQEPSGLSSLLYSGRSGLISATPARWLNRTESFSAPLSSTPSVDPQEAAVAAHTQSLSIAGTSVGSRRVKKKSECSFCLFTLIVRCYAERSLNKKKKSTPRRQTAVEKALRLIKAAEKKPKKRTHGRHR